MGRKKEIRKFFKEVELSKGENVMFKSSILFDYLDDVFIVVLCK